MEKIIHQIWLGPYSIPSKEKEFSNKIKEIHPSWDYIFWNNENLPKLPLELQELVSHFEKNKKWVNIADLYRYYIIAEYGGLYIDCDYGILNSLDSLQLEKYEGFLPLHFNVGETICNSVFGFNKNHKIIKYIVEQLYKVEYHNDWVGPHFFGKHLKNSIGFKDDDIDCIIDRKLSEMNIKTIHSRGEFKAKYMIHHYSYNWHPLNQQKLKINES
jgi:hypothetical protein